MVLKFLKSGYTKVKAAFTRTREALSQKLSKLLGREINEETLEELERTLYEADLGVETAAALTEKIKQAHRKHPAADASALIAVLKQEILHLIADQERGFCHPANSPLVILVVGVNGNGKTTSIAKIAKMLKKQNKQVLVGAADTFRAAAGEQLELWAKRVGVDLVKGQPKSDPAAVAFDTLSAGKARGADAILLDTAGRLHTKTALMQELQKLRRVCNKVVEGSPHETLLVLDATTGQNAIDQAHIFHEYTPLTGLILTKLDGTARGGIVVNIQSKLKIPVKFIGVGEGEDDLIPFQPTEFVDALFA